MTHADALLRNVLDHPDDDAPRLLYADWLDEQGDVASVARAEFIRVQCALAAKRLPAGRREELKQREQELLHRYDKEWSRPIRRLVKSWVFRRGFVDYVFLGAVKFITCAGRLFRRAPVQGMRLVIGEHHGGPAEADFSMPALAECKYLRRLRVLDLGENLLDSQDVRALLVSRHLGGLRTLRLAENGIGDGGARALAEAPLLATLSFLDLSHNAIGPAGARALAGALRELDRRAVGLRLRELNLEENPLGAAGRRVFAGSAVLRRLVRT